MSQAVTIESQESIDEIVKDQTSLSLKHQLMGKLKWNALLGSIAESSKFVAGPLFGVGIGTALTPAGAFMAPFLLAAALAFLVVGVVAGYASTRIWQSGQFDNFEINAASTARHLVQELRTSKSVMQEHEQNGRADGKTWTQVVKPEQQLPVRT